MPNTYKYSLQTTGGAAWLAEGQVVLNNGIISLNEYPLYHFLKQFERQHVEIAVMPVVSQYTIDEKIQNLVNKLNEKGLITIASCEGHIRSDGIYRPFPWVAFKCIHDIPIPPKDCGWCLTYFEEDSLHLIPIWRTIVEARNTEELENIQDTYINALLEKL